jgi:hypothetical protein
MFSYSFFFFFNRKVTGQEAPRLWLSRTQNFQ